MPTEPLVDFKKVKQSVSMLRVLEYYGVVKTLKENEVGLRGPCPICHSKNSFSVNTSRNCWNCFGNCKHGGNVLDFVARKENTDVRTAAQNIARWLKLDAEWKA